MVQRRQDGSVDFNRNWGEYEDGFGELTGEFWYGLRALHCLTGQGGWEMRIDIMLANGTRLFFQYEQFKIASAQENYKLTAERFHGTTNDPMAWHNENYFTTSDNDNDEWSGGNCAGVRNGGWWFTACVTINLNGHYNSHTYSVYLYGQPFILKFSELKIRPSFCIIQ